MSSGALFLLSTVPEGRLFALDLQTLIGIAIQLVNALVLAAILSFLLYKPVRNFLQKRIDRISGQIKSTEAKLAEADALKAHFEQKMREVERERAEILEGARKVAAEKRGELIDEAKKDADSLRERARLEMQREQERVKDEIRRYIIQASSAMAKKILTHTIDQDTQNRLFDQTIAELEETPWLS